MSPRSSYRWIPWTFAAALGVVVAVNGALAYFAATSSTGMVTEHPFDTGKSYNHLLDAAVAQDALGWKASLRFVSSGASHGRIIAELEDREGGPLTGLGVTARLVRPVEPLPAQVFSLREETPGHYTAETVPGRPGQWDVRVSARRGGDLYEFVQRIVVK